MPIYSGAIGEKSAEKNVSRHLLSSVCVQYELMQVFQFSDF